MCVIQKLFKNTGYFVIGGVGPYSSRRKTWLYILPRIWKCSYKRVYFWLKVLHSFSGHRIQWSSALPSGE